MKKKSGEFEKSPIKARWLWLIIPLFIGGCYTQKKGYQKVRDMRQLERIPQTDVVSLIEGEVSIRGKAVSSSNTVKANSEKSKSRIIGPNNRRRDDSTFSNNKRSSTYVSGKYSGTKCFYCYYKKERRSVDEDGNESWSTVESGTRHVRFFRIKDSTGDVLVSLDSLIKEARKSPSLRQDYYRRSGNYRWTERRIDIGEEIFVFAMAVTRRGDYELNFAEEGSYSPILSDGNAVSSRTQPRRHWGPAHFHKPSMPFFGGPFLMFHDQDSPDPGIPIYNSQP